MQCKLIGAFAGLAMLAGVGTAEAGTVLVGDLVLNERDFVDQSAVFDNGLIAPDLAGIVDGSAFDDRLFLQPENVLRADFTDNLVVNNAGNDVFLFANTSIPDPIAAGFEFSSQSVLMEIIGTTRFDNGIETGGVFLSIYALDLSDLGLGLGESQGQSLFFSSSSGSPGVMGIATAPIPIPAALPLLLTAFSVLGVLGWLRHKPA